VKEPDGSRPNNGHVSATAQTVVVALGGNAILQPGQVGTFEEQLVNVDQSCRRIARLVADGWRVILTHGNGPQVGNILIQNDLAAKLVAPMPMDVCGAETQGQIGYMLQQSLHNHMVKLRLRVPVATFLTEVVVDQRDPAFAAPSKPVGPFYPEARAKELAIEQGLVVREDAGRGWRRVVPSPRPTEIVQRPAIADAVAAGVLVVCNGGGGIPVVRHRDGSLHGVEAVIDKDLAAARLALDLEADVLLILTDVAAVYVGYKTPGQRALARVSVAEMERYQAAGEFKAGSKGPKVEAALQFAHAGGRAVIASLLDVAAALRGQAGTTIAGSR
jgi:carbamate kinase